MSTLKAKTPSPNKSKLKVNNAKAGEVKGKAAAAPGKDELEEKLVACYQALWDAWCKMKIGFNAYKQNTFFSPDRNPEFIKRFTELIKEVGPGVDEMGAVLKALTNVKGNFTATDSASEESEKTGLNQLPSADEFIHEPETNGILLKDGAISITPPASDAGNDDELFNTVSEETIKARESRSSNLGKKRSPSHTDPSSSPQVSKRPRRSLMDQYITVTKKAELNDSTTINSEKLDEPNEKEESEYEVESIIDCKKAQGTCFYLVSWRGYSSNDNTWEPPENLSGCDEMLVEFYKDRLKKRELSKTEEEFSKMSLIGDPTVRNLQRQAIRSLIKESISDTQKSLKILLTSNSKPGSKVQVDVNDLADRIILARKKPRYDKLMETLTEHLSIQEIEGKRKKQLAELRTWERNINSVCSDPAKLMVENNIDLELPPKGFVYINEFQEGKDVTIPSEPVVGCECEDCSSNSKSCCPDQMNSWMAYNKYGKLKVSLGTPIYECNKMCKCRENCVNRVVQKGRNLSLCIFRTPNNRGWGVKAMENIKKDTFVTEYVGEVITSEEAERRGRIYDAQGCTYLFDLDYNKGDQNPYTVDATTCGNVSHFINHSCDPNLVVFNVWVNCLDPDLPRLALFSGRDIKKGEEITFDYNSGIKEEQIASGAQDSSKTDDEIFTPEKDGVKNEASGSSDTVVKTPKGTRGLQYGKTECRCGAPNCRKYFF